MRVYLYVVSLLLIIGAQLGAQTKVTYDPLQAPDSYQSIDNPNYWKNKMPRPGYWQQDVYYNIKADVDEQTNIIDGSLELTYWNNSPDTLHEVFFHLYQNAFQPCAYYDNLQHNNGVDPKYGPYESACLGTTLEYLRSNGQDLPQTLDNTMLRVQLDEPLLPGKSKQFEMKFKTFFGSGNVRRRMKQYGAWGYKHLNGVHWYPRISVYDHKFGWTTDQHLGREFYADFGTYDVELTFANNMIVEATGYLQNREEVMPDSLRKKLDISNFKDKPWGERPSTIIPYDTAVHKTWKYHAENVHNVAFTADPSYRIGEVERNGIRSIALVQEPHAGKWQEVAAFTADVIDVYERDFGKYGYHKMIVADAADGMEYPMLTLCGGSFPSNKGLIAHEVGHNWFYGMVGNNETYRAALDEGFTQFLTAWSLEAIDGKYIEPQAKYKSKYKQKFSRPTEIRNSRVYDGYIWDALDGEDAFLNTHSDGFNGALRHGGGYRHVYYKTAVMLYNLQYVLGDSLFQDAMRNYFHEYSYAHPYMEDMRESFIHYTKTDLNWFFDQWLETMKNIDYGVKRVKRVGQQNGELQYEITLRRKGRMQMPIDLSVVTVDGDTIDYYIPNTWFTKETDAQLLPKWHGWDKLHPTYTTTISVPAKVRNVIIDKTQRLADVNMLNNSKKVPVDFAFDSKIYTRPDWRTYELNMRPDLWWNAYDGLKAGVHLNGNYLNYRHVFKLSVYGTLGGLGQGDPERFGFPESAKKKHDWFNFTLDYRTSLSHFVKGMSAYYKGQYFEGLEMHNIGIKQDIGKNSEVTLFMKLMTRPQAGDRYHLLYPNEWVTDMINNSFNLRWDHNYTYDHGSGRITGIMRSSAIASDFDYHYMELEKVNYTNFWRLQLRTRLFARFGTGSNPAPESMLFFSGANNEQLMDYALTRSVGYVPPAWVGGYGAKVNHFQVGGGLNMRGYAGYELVETVDGVTYRAYKGHSGAAINAELDLDGIVKWRPRWFRDHFKFDVYLFGDAGAITFDTNDGRKLSQVRADAGAGVTMTIKNWGPLRGVKPLVLRFDVPFYISHAPAAEPDNVKFRWVIGVQRSF